MSRQDLLARAAPWIHLGMLIAGLAASVLTLAGRAAQHATVTVAAGAHDRHNTVVSFMLPAAHPIGCAVLNDGRSSLPLQVSEAGEATFVIPQLKAGETGRYTVRTTECGADRKTPAMEARRDGAVVRVSADGRPVFSYQAEPDHLPRPDIKPIFRRGGYIHPVFTPEGRAITDDYPVDHPHHHGIWWAWTKTEYDGRQPDFWNMGAGTGRVDFEALDATWNGSVHAGFEARTTFTDVTGGRTQTVLTDRWHVRAYAVPPDARILMFDLLSTQTVVGSEPLVLPQYRYGGLGVRGHSQWNGTGEKTVFLTSDGKTRADGNGTKARWTHMGGLIDGRSAGIAILDHPGNFRAPQPTRLNPENPFFNYSPSVAGPWTIEPGVPYVSRYRFVTYEGEPDRALIERLWNDYADPPVVTLKAR